MVRYLTKRQLYSQIHQYKQGLGLDHNDYRFNMLHICKQKGILLEQIPFSTKHLRGMAAIGSVPGEDVILLNSNRSNTLMFTQALGEKGLQLFRRRLRQAR